MADTPKEHSNLEEKLLASRKPPESESLEPDAIQRLQADIEGHKRREHQLRESEAKFQQQLAEIERTERELRQLKLNLRHPVAAASRLSRRIVGSLTRKLIRLRHRSENHQAPVVTRPQVKVELDFRADNTLPRRVCIVAPAFFDMEGKVPYFGGAERYLYELAQVIRSLGYEPEIYQPAKGDWIRHFRNLVIRGLDTNGHTGEMNTVFHKRVPKPDLTIYLAFFLAAPKCFQPSIGISHGIYWDADYFHHTADRLRNAVQEVLSCFKNLRTIISVDTNTINWVRTISASLAEKFHYVPNFVDLSQFRSRPTDYQRSAEKVVILFPRRLYKARGFWLLTEVMHEILSRHPQAVFHFVGQAGDDREQGLMTSVLSEYPNRVRWDILPPDQMHEAYWAADIAVIPTLFAEGTSLSCLEAMASGNAVIATDVGGLTNLVLHRYNGLLIRPAADDLLAALSLLIQDKQLRAQLAGRALETAQVFSLEEWKTKWRQLLSRDLPQQPPRTVRKVRRPSRTVVVENPSLEWMRMKQRPHYLADQFVSGGWEVFWRQPVMDQKSSLPHMHITSNDEPFFGDSPFLYIFYPFDFERISNYRNPIVIYDLLDDISIHDNNDERAGLAPGKRARDYHEKLLRRADLVTTSSRVLFEKAVKIRPDTMLVPNGVDLALFDFENHRKGRLPAELSGIPGPRIGFHGAIAEWFDADLVSKLVRACPEYQFVFVGPVTNERMNGMATLPNCHFLGEKSPSEIPLFLNTMDLSLVPFVDNATTAGVRPLKVLESLAMRRPVVASPLPEMKDWPYVFAANGELQFQATIKQALQAAKEMRGDANLTRFLQINSWAESVRPLLFRMNRLLLQRMKTN